LFALGERILSIPSPALLLQLSAALLACSLLATRFARPVRSSTLSSDYFTASTVSSTLSSVAKLSPSAPIVAVLVSLPLPTPCP
jgi:hypothetical protein